MSCAKSSQHRVLPLFPWGILVIMEFFLLEILIPTSVAKAVVTLLLRNTVISSSVFLPADRIIES